MVNGGALLLVHELFELGVASSDSLSCEVALANLLADSGKVAIECLAAMTAFLLTNVASVGPSSNEETTKEESKVAVTAVVEGVRLVPVRESPSVLMSKGSLISSLQVTVNAA